MLTIGILNFLRADPVTCHWRKLKLFSLCGIRQHPNEERRNCLRFGGMCLTTKVTQKKPALKKNCKDLTLQNFEDIYRGQCWLKYQKSRPCTVTRCRLPLWLNTSAGVCFPLTKKTNRCNGLENAMHKLPLIFTAYWHIPWEQYKKCTFIGWIFYYSSSFSCNVVTR